MATGRITYHPLDPSKNRHFVDGREVTREQFEKAFPPKPIDFDSAPGGHLSSCWPMLSDACMVHPDQAKAATETARRLGVPTEFKRDGRPEFVSQAHRRDYCRKVMKMHDRNGCYGDP